jgi:DNA-binding MarR family transcriptional regulator
VDDTRWLDDDERAAWLSLIGVTLLLPTALDAQLQRDTGVTHFDYLVLAMLSESGDRTLTMSELATRASSSLSRLSHVVAKLEKRGWIARRPSPRDGRTTIAVLTDDGMAAIVGAAPRHVDRVRTLVFDALTPTEVRQLAAIGTKVLTRLDPQQRCGPARP